MYSHLGIFCCDDSQDDVFFMKRALLEAGINVRVDEVHSGDDAKDFLAARGEHRQRRLPHLVLLDIKMPGTDGLEVLQWIRGTQDLKSLPVVMCSSSELQKDVDRAHELGADGYIVKPHGLSEYRELAVALERFWLSKNKYPSCCGGRAERPEA